MIFNTSLLSTAYFPPIEYFVAIANSKLVEIDALEMYQKQSYRTRCHINSANGLLVLTIPVLRGGEIESERNHKLPITEIKIDYSKPWVQQHKRSIEAAYKSSPFFEYYVDDIFPILDAKEQSLFNLNYNLITKLIELLGLNPNLKILNLPQQNPTENIPIPNNLLPDNIDLRTIIHPKKDSYLIDKLALNKPYYQVFTNKQGFIKNLSIIDLLFNEGPNSISFLESHSNRE
jgi:WbqC-like protein family.